MQIRKDVFAEDEHGNTVLMVPGDSISDISDAGYVLSVPEISQMGGISPDTIIGWNVSFKFSPKENNWTEILTCDTVKLLKALEGKE